MTLRTKRIVIWSSLAAAVIALALPKILSEKADANGGESGARNAASGGSRGATPSSGSGARGGGAKGPVAVRAVVLASEQLDDALRVTGTLLPNEQVDLQTETSGKITGIYFSEGQVVGSGKLLVRINDSELRAQHKRAVYRRTLAAAKEKRSRELLGRNAVSAADYDVALSELNTANAEIELIQAQLDKTQLRAPFSGVIGFRQVSLGSYVSPATRIATLSSTDPIKIEFFVPERYQPMVRPGSTITFSVEGSNEERSGRVYAIEPRIEQTTRTLQVRASAPNPGARLMPGSFAQIAVRLSRSEKAISIPSEAVVPEARGKTSVFIASNGKAERRDVTIGLRTESNVQVLAGLSAGDTVIVSGIQMVKPGGSVNVTIAER